MENRAVDIIKENPSAALQWSQEQIQTIRNTVALNASDDELNMFLSLASRYNLDPFAREIWFIKYPNRGQDKTTIFTSRDGYLKIANLNEHFQGMESDVVYAGDKFIKNRDGVQHTYSTSNRGNPVGAYAVVYRDDRTVPAYAFAPMKDYYNQNSKVWSTYPHSMILKVAEAMALKRAFSISGLVTQEELGGQDSDGRQTIEIVHQTHSENPPDDRKKRISAVWNGFLEVCDNQPNHARNAVKVVVGDKPSKDFTEKDIEELEADLKRRQQKKITKDNGFDFSNQQAQDCSPEPVDVQEVEEN